MSKPKWRSLKLGDCVLRPWSALALVAEQRFKQSWPGQRTVYWRKGLMLNLLTGETVWYELDDCIVRGEIVRVAR